MTRGLCVGQNRDLCKNGRTKMSFWICTCVGHRNRVIADRVRTVPTVKYIPGLRGVDVYSSTCPFITVFSIVYRRPAHAADESAFAAAEGGDAASCQITLVVYACC